MLQEGVGSHARITEARRRLDAVAALGEKIGPPSCKSCVHGPIGTGGIGSCDHPVHWRLRHDPVTGKLIGRIDEISTDKARSEGGLCGPEALLFDERRPGERAARWVAEHDPVWLFLGFCSLLGLGIVIATGGQ